MFHQIYPLPHHPHHPPSLHHLTPSPTQSILNLRQASHPRHSRLRRHDQLRQLFAQSGQDVREREAFVRFEHVDRVETGGEVGRLEEGVADQGDVGGVGRGDAGVDCSVSYHFPRRVFRWRLAFDVEGCTCTIPYRVSMDASREGFCTRSTRDGDVGDILLAWQACNTFNARLISPLLNRTKLSTASGTICTSSFSITRSTSCRISTSFKGLNRNRVHRDSSAGDSLCV